VKTRIAIVLITIISSLLINKNAKAQFTDTIANSKNNYFFISPLPLIDGINPALTVGYERKISERFAFQIEGGPILKHSLIGYFFTGLGFGTRDAWWRNKGGKIRAEFKIFPKNQSKTTFERYYSCEIFMTRNISNVTQLFTVSDTTFDYTNEDVRFAGDGIYNDFYIIHRNRYGANFKIGIKAFDKNKVTIDSSVGLGIVYQSAYESGRTNYNDKPFQGSSPFLKPGNRILPSLTVGIKIGLKK
jgi:hypothetical protein